MTENTEEITEPETKTTPGFAVRASRTFLPWLQSVNGALAFTTYQAGKLFFIGVNNQTGRMSIFERSFPRCMGFGVDQHANGTTLWMSSLYQLWRIENFLEEGKLTPDGYDAVFVPIEGRTTGDIDIHDIHPLSGNFAPTFVATRFNCLATFDRRNSFRPVWTPRFIDKIAAEDRCHLNGLAMRNGKPAYVTCVATTNTAGGWREHRHDGGVLIDVETNELIVSGLSMPHSPRVHNDEVYMLQSGTGEFGRIDLQTGRFEAMTFIPGFVRGVSFIGNHAVVGVSRPRREGTLDGLAINERLKDERIEPKTMIAIINLETGDMEHTLEIEGVVRELYDVGFIPGIKRPKMLGFQTPEIRFQVRPAPYEFGATESEAG